MNQGNIEYIEIGRDKVGKYPINIIPFSKDDLLN